MADVQCAPLIEISSRRKSSLTLLPQAALATAGQGATVPTLLSDILRRHSKEHRFYILNLLSGSLQFGYCAMMGTIQSSI